MRLRWAQNGDLRYLIEYERGGEEERQLPQMCSAKVWLKQPDPAISRVCIVDLHHHIPDPTHQFAKHLQRTSFDPGRFLRTRGFSIHPTSDRVERSQPPFSLSDKPQVLLKKHLLKRVARVFS